jgi:hypothetical protein
LGQVANFSFLLQNARGKYFIWLSDDDWLEEGIIEKCVMFLEKHDDHVLAGGQVKYWKDGKPDLVEEGFTLGHHSGSVRVVNFYAKVVYCGMLHGVHRTAVTKMAPMRKIVGNDLQLMANVAFMGKFRQFDWIGYNKNFGGLSASPRRYAKAMNDSRFAGEFPQIKIAFDACKEVLFRSPVFRELKFLKRLGLALTAFWARIYCFYFKVKLWPRVQRLIIDPIRGKRVAST